MTAPLFAEYCKRLKREYTFKHLGKRNDFKQALLSSRVKSKVYSLSGNASEELGAMSTAEPRTLLDIVENMHAPAPFTFVEIDWRRATRGMERVLTTPPDSPKEPTRVGFVYLPSSAIEEIRSNVSAPVDKSVKFSSLFGCAMFENGQFELKNMVMGFSEQNIFEEQANNKAQVVEKMSKIPNLYSALGHDYSRLYKDKPRVLKKLAQHMDMFSLYGAEFNGHEYMDFMANTNGMVRIAMCALAMAANAHGKRMPPSMSSQPVRTASGKTVSREVTEVDVFLSAKVPTYDGRTATRAVRASLRANKRLHDVRGHWAWRRPPAGELDTRIICRSALNGGAHSWQNLNEEKTRQCCELCGQTRWWRPFHSRGDEKVGVMPNKVMNVRV